MDFDVRVQPGVTRKQLNEYIRDQGLFFPIDPGADASLGGMTATRASGTNAVRYGTMRDNVLSLTCVMPNGEVVRTARRAKKSSAGYDLTRLMVGSEGTLGIVTAAWLRLVPAPEARGVVVSFFDSSSAGCEAILAVMASGIQPTALEFLDRGTLAAAIGSLPFDAPADPGFAVLAEADGSPQEVERVLGELDEAMAEAGAAATLNISERSQAEALWSWRDGISYAVAAQRGGKISEDIVVPAERLAEAIDGTIEIGSRHGLEACSWGHAGDGNLHSTFLVDLDDADQMRRGKAASDELFEMAISLGGSISGEHGIGSLKTSHVRQALGQDVVALQAEIKRAFDPKLLLNPGKKIPLV